MPSLNQPIVEARLLLLRHAETAAPDRFHGAESDIALSDRGHEQARDVAARLAVLRPTAVYCSGLRRARDTAEPIARACGLDPIVIEDLHERRMGPLSNTPRDLTLPIHEEAKRRWQAGELDHTHEGGESYSAIRDRVVPIFQELSGRHRGQTTVVVAHGIVVRVVLTSLVVGLAPVDFERIAIDYVRVHDLRADRGTWRLVP